MIIVTPKICPDLDGYACAFAYAEFLNKKRREAVGIAVGDLQQEVKFLNKEFGIRELPNDGGIIQDADGIVIVDASNLLGMPNIDPKKVIEVIDHRNASKVEELFPNAKIQIEKIGAAATLIFERFRENSVLISKESGILLCCAIASNTLNFQVSFTSKRDKAGYDWLRNKFNIPPNLIHRMFVFKSRFDDESFKNAIIGDFKEFEIGNKLIGIAQLEVIGLRNVLEERKGQLFEIFEKVKTEKNLDYIFLTAVDLEEWINLFVTNHEPTKHLIEKALGVSFENKDIAHRQGVILRKEIVPLLEATIC